MSEKRKYKRVDKQLKIAISGSDLFNYQETGVTRNISGSGIALRSPVQIGLNKIRTCKISVNGSRQAVEAVIKVVWEKELDGEYEIGIKFLDIDEKFLLQIQKHLIDA